MSSRIRVACFSLALLCLVVSVSAMSVTYYTPTPPNMTVLSSVPQNVSIHAVLDIGGTPLSSANYSWNGTSFSLYDSSLVLAYDFDNNTAVGDNATFVKDFSRSANNGNVLNGAYYVSGKYNAGLRFDGVNDFVNVVGLNNTNLSRVTISGWIKLKNSSQLAYARVFDKRYDIGFAVVIAPASTTPEVWWNGGDAFTSSASLTVNRWDFIAFTHNGTYAKFYVNGIQTASKATTTYPEGGYILALGGGDNTNPLINLFPLNGDIDAVRMWNRALSDSEVQTIYLSNFYKFNASWYDFSVIQSVNTGGMYSYSVSGQDSLDYFGSSTFVIYANTTNYTIGPRVSVCEPMNSNILQGSETLVQDYVTQFTFPLDTTWFTVNETFKNSTRAVNGYNFMVWKTSTELGNYSVRCWANDTQGNQYSLYDGHVSIYTTTTTTLPSYWISNLNANYSCIRVSDLTGNICYQEFANETTACGGLNTGSYRTEDDF